MFRRLPGIDRDTDVADAMQTCTGPTGRKPNIQPIATDIAYLPAPTCDLQAWKPRSIFSSGSQRCHCRCQLASLTLKWQFASLWRSFRRSRAASSFSVGSHHHASACQYPVSSIQYPVSSHHHPSAWQPPASFTPQAASATQPDSSG